MANVRHRGSEARRAERTQQAFELRKQGMPYGGIARELGCGVGTVHRDVQRVIQRYEAESRETLEAMRWCEAESLNELAAPLHEQFKATHEAAFETVEDDGDAEQKVLMDHQAAALSARTARTILAIMARRAKLLGLDATPRNLIPADKVQQIMSRFTAVMVELTSKYVPRDLRPRLAEDVRCARDSLSRKAGPNAPAFGEV